MSNKADFKKDLSLGKQGEALFHEMWAELEALDGKKGDFIAPDFTTLELKTERRALADTENMFVEVWSDVHKKKPGGPYQAFGRGCTYFAYLYLPDKTAFVFNTHELITFLASKKYSEIYIRNRAWTSSGYKVPRKDVEALVVKILKPEEAK